MLHFWVLIDLTSRWAFQLILASNLASFFNYFFLHYLGFTKVITSMYKSRVFFPDLLSWCYFTWVIDIPKSCLFYQYYSSVAQNDLMSIISNLWKRFIWSLTTSMSSFIQILIEINGVNQYSLNGFDYFLIGLELSFNSNQIYRWIENESKDRSSCQLV